VIVSGVDPPQALDEELPLCRFRWNKEQGLDTGKVRHSPSSQLERATVLDELDNSNWNRPSGGAWSGDLTYAMRALRKNPIFAAVVVMTLALGIGATTVAFSVVHAVLLKPLPFRDPQRLVMVWEKWDRRHEDRVVVSPGNFTDWRRLNQSFEHMAAITGGRATLIIDSEPTAVAAATVSAEFFRTLGVQPFLGRTFHSEEERKGKDNVTILGYGLWQRLGAERNLIGKTLLVYRRPHTVVGIMPPGFSFPDESQIWLPLALNQNERSNHELRVIGKLKPGTDAAQAQTEMQTIAAALARSYPRDNDGIGASVVPLMEQIVGGARRSLLVLLGVVVSVLLIACTNIANLLFVRASDRGREFAIRAALGASRWRLMRLLLTESVLLALLGGALGVGGAYWLVRMLVAFDPIQLPRVHEIGINLSVLLFSLMVTVLTGVLFGIAPAIRISQMDLDAALKEHSTSQATGGFRRKRGRAALAAAQVGLAVVLLVAAGLLLRSFVLRVTVPLGFRPQGTLAVELPYWVNQNVDQLLDRLQSVPGVEVAGAGNALPHQSPNTICNSCIEIEGSPSTQGENRPSGVHIVTPGYFRAAGLALHRGRFLDGNDGAGTFKVAVINEAFVRRFFPGADPLGRHIRWSGGEWLQIVGVVGDVKGFGMEANPVPAVYMTNKQTSWDGPVSVLVRTSLPPKSLAGTLRKQLRLWNTRMVIGQIATVEDLLSESVAVPRFYMLIVSGFATLALFMAAIGVYGTISHSVLQRTQEIGVRMALGAERGDILFMIMLDGISVIAVGMVLGSMAAWVSTRFLESLLFGIRPGDLPTFVGASVLLLVVGLLASCIPACRATRVNLVKTLRSE